MNRKERLRRHNIPADIARAQRDHMRAIEERLYGSEPTGNAGIVYPDGRMDIGDVRDIERESIQPLQDPRVFLPNPVADAPMDRMAPLPRVAKNEALGFQVQPDRLVDLPPGDAGAGASIFRRTHVFARLNSPISPDAPVVGNPFDKAIPMATCRSSDKRPRFWHVSMLGIGVQRVANGVALEPLTNDQILSQQLEPITRVGTGAITNSFIPSVSQLKARVMIFDESGQRFFDFDVLGNRSIDVYAWGVTVFILAPGNLQVGGLADQSAYEVNAQNGALATPGTAFEGLVEDSIIGCRIVPIVLNSTDNTENRTITFITPPGASETAIPIPPGAKKVQLFCHEDAATAAFYTIRFDAGDDGTFAGRSDLGIIDINAAQSRTDLVEVVNSAQIIVSATDGGTPLAGWSIVFQVEGQ